MGAQALFDGFLALLEERRLRWQLRRVQPLPWDAGVSEQVDGSMSRLHYLGCLSRYHSTSGKTVGKGRPFSDFRWSLTRT